MSPQRALAEAVEAAVAALLDVRNAVEAVLSEAAEPADDGERAPHAQRATLADGRMRQSLANHYHQKALGHLGQLAGTVHPKMTAPTLDAEQRLRPVRGKIGAKR